MDRLFVVNMSALGINVLMFVFYAVWRNITLDFIQKNKPKLLKRPDNPYSIDVTTKEMFLPLWVVLFVMVALATHYVEFPSAAFSHLVTLVTMFSCISIQHGYVMKCVKICNAQTS